MRSWRATYSKSWVLTWEGSARVSKQVADAIQPESRRFSSRGLEGSTPKPGNKILLRWSSVVNYATVYSWLLLRIRPITTAWALVAADPVQKPDKKPAGDDVEVCQGKGLPTLNHRLFVPARFTCFLLEFQRIAEKCLPALRGIAGYEFWRFPFHSPHHHRHQAKSSGSAHAAAAKAGVQTKTTAIKKQRRNTSITQNADVGAEGSAAAAAVAAKPKKRKDRVRAATADRGRRGRRARKDSSSTDAHNTSNGRGCHTGDRGAS